MTRRWQIVAGAALALLATGIAVRGGMWDRPLSMDNRLYFYIAERAASGVAPHVSTPDVKNQLSALADGASIALGRTVGLHDVRAGRIGLLLLLIAGIWGIGFSVHSLGATRGAAALGALSALSFSNLIGHTAVGFNPKVLLFTMLAWGPGLVARGRFAAAGAMAAAAMLCWQPAAIACVATALGALVAERPFRALARTVAGGLAMVVLYETYFAWHGALAAQLFQSYGLPLGSIHEPADWLKGIRFVLVGSEHGIDALAIPAVCFVALTLGAALRGLGMAVPFAGRAAAPAPAMLMLTAGGMLMCLFTVYEHQAEPDRFLLCAPFAIAIGVVADRLLHFARSRVHERTSFQLEGALFAILLLSAPRRDYTGAAPNEVLLAQTRTGHVVAMLAEAYGSVWSYGCYHLMGLAHLNNHHPFDHNWDDLRRYFDETTFVPLVRGRMPDVILKCRGLPGPDNLLDGYSELALPGLADTPKIYVRKTARTVSADEHDVEPEEGSSRKGRRAAGRSQSRKAQRRT